jgi:RNA binding exosome subunit
MSDDYSQRAARGQAYNLAIQTSIADGKHGDRGYVLKQYLKHLSMAEALQKASIEQIKNIIKQHESEQDED